VTKSAERTVFSNIELAKIRPGRNVRGRLHGIEGLAQSLREHGMLQPITVVPTEDGDEVEVMFGHRRLAAAKVAPLVVVPCFMRPRGDEMNRLWAQAAENFDREEMTSLDEARLFSDLVDLGMTQEQVAVRTRRSQAHVSRYLRLLRYPLEVQEAVGHHRIGIFDALSIPMGLLDKPAAMKTLPAALVSVGKLRLWITSNIAPGAKVQYSAPHANVKLSLALADRVKVIAKTRGLYSWEWVEEAVNEKLAREAAK
jgi:ParB/RepB/Spo0J family partition protein